ncbi:UNC-like C-terminal-domain-containing protein [Russula dissimulans]|nr:UNC-like C-terminal-domain-containing protein [Russula dissimulans]
MFTRPRSWLPTSLLCLLFTSPVLSGHSPNTTPYDQFRAIAALAPKPSEVPVCCLETVTPLEPVDDDLFLSFEDWKSKRFSESRNGQKSSNVPPNSSAQTRLPAESQVEATASPVYAAHPPDIADAAPTVQTAAGDMTAFPQQPASSASSSPHFRVPLTDRFNYASLDCSARVHAAHRAAKSAANILSSQRDRYMLSPCAATAQFVVVELCDDIRIDTVQLANFEFFSGMFRKFTVSVAKTHAAVDAEGWTVVGTYVAKNVRGVQSFHPPTSVRDFYRYLRIEFHSHYSNEYYCPISLLRVYGLTHLEQWKWDIWEEESRARQDLNAQASIVHIDTLRESEPPADSPAQAQEAPTVSKENPSPATLAGDSTPDSQDRRVELLSSESVGGDFRRSTDTARPESSTSPSTDSDSPIIATPSSASSQPPDSVHATDNSMQGSHMFISNDSTLSTATASSSVLIAPRSMNVSASQPTVTTTSSPITHPSAPPPPPVHYPVSPSPPANVHTGESIYRTIMNRLSALEANTTLYARYVEEQTNAMREMLRRLSEDVGRLEGITRAQAQMYARSVSEFERHRREMDSEQRTLISQVNYLAAEIILEKRLGIAQLCLLLAVLVFLSVTRGSPGEFHVARASGGGTDAAKARGWGRRGMRLSADWVPSRLRSASAGPPPAAPAASIPHAARFTPQTAPPAPAPGPSLSLSAIATPSPGPGHLENKVATTTTTTTVTPTPAFRQQKRAPHYLLLTPMQHHPHHHHPHRTPRSHSALPHSRTRATAGPGPGSPTRTSGPVSAAMARPLPIQRSYSYSHGHGGPLVGPVPRSARRWARSAHLHDVRRARQQQQHQQQQSHQQHYQATSFAATDEDEEDVFAVAPLPRSRKGSQGQSKSRGNLKGEGEGEGHGQIMSAPAVASFGLDVPGADADDNGAGGAARTWNRRGELAEAEADTDSAGVAADTWVDTDTETDADEDADVGVWQVDVDKATV